MTGPINDFYGFHGVAPAHLEIVGIVRGRDLHRARSELAVHEIIRDDGDFTIYKRQYERCAHNGRISFIRGVDGHRGVAEHGFGPRRGDAYESLPAFKRVFEMIELALHLFVFGFLIRQRGLAARAPVDDVFAPVNESFAIKLNEHFAHGPGQAFVHGKAFPVPVAGAAEFFKLA